MQPTLEIQCFRFMFSFPSNVGLVSVTEGKYKNGFNILFLHTVSLSYNNVFFFFFLFFVLLWYFEKGQIRCACNSGLHFVLWLVLIVDVKCLKRFKYTGFESKSYHLVTLACCPSLTSSSIETPKTNCSY